MQVYYQSPVINYPLFYQAICPTLASQQEHIVPLLDPELFRETPSFTTLVWHKVQLKEDAPVHQKCYRIPEWLVPMSKKEIKLMLEMGIIVQPCCSGTQERWLTEILH